MTYRELIKALFFAEPQPNISEDTRRLDWVLKHGCPQIPVGVMQRPLNMPTNLETRDDIDKWIASNLWASSVLDRNPEGS